MTLRNLFAAILLALFIPCASTVGQGPTRLDSNTVFRTGFGTTSQANAMITAINNGSILLGTNVLPALLTNGGTYNIILDTGSTFGGQLPAWWQNATNQTNFLAAMAAAQPGLVTNGGTAKIILDTGSTFGSQLPAWWQNAFNQTNLAGAITNALPTIPTNMVQGNGISLSNNNGTWTISTNGTGASGTITGVTNTDGYLSVATANGTSTVGVVYPQMTFYSNIAIGTTKFSISGWPTNGHMLRVVLTAPCTPPVSNPFWSVNGDTNMAYWTKSTPAVAAGSWTQATNLLFYTGATNMSLNPTLKIPPVPDDIWIMNYSATNASKCGYLTYGYISTINQVGFNGMIFGYTNWSAVTNIQFWMSSGAFTNGASVFWEAK